MEYLILNLARILRASGIKVSSREVSDCIHLLNLTAKDKLTNQLFYTIVNTAMIKTEWGKQYIQQLVELYFEPDEELTGNRFLDPFRQVSATTGEGLGTSGQGLPVDLMLAALLKKDVARIYALVKGMNLDLSLLREDRQEALVDFKQRSGWLEVREMVEKAFRAGQISPREYEAAQESLREWIVLLKEEIEARLIKNMSRGHLTELMKKNNPHTLKFAEADGSQLAQISREVEKLGKKLAVKKGRRWKAGKRGRINLNKSLKKAVQTGGILLDLTRMEPKPAKPDLWLLCDMSNSVRRFSYFMLMFIYTIQKRFNIRSFIFVDMLLEVTDYFKEQEWDKALNSLNTLRGFNLTGYSHYGNVLHQFYDTAHTLLNHKTTVLILGDAKNNRNKSDGSEVLSQIREEARALYWLNPLQEELWSQGDCVMEKYSKDCTAVYQCSNLSELKRFVEEVF